MKIRPLAVAILGVVLTIPGEVVAVPPSPAADAAAGAQYVPGEVLVKFKPTVTAQGSHVTVASRSHSVLSRLSRPGWAHVRVAQGESVDDAVAAYRADPNVEYAQPNYIYHIVAVPNDPHYGQLWALKNEGQTVSDACTQPPSSPLDYATANPGTRGDDMDIERAWEHITDCSGVAVAVVDSGVNYDHEDLASNMWDGGASFPNHGYDFVDDDNDPTDLNGHGTHVAGIIGAVGNNATGTTGVCWKATIMAVRACDAAGSCTTARVIQGIDFSRTHGAKVINMSLGGVGAFDQLFSDAITATQNAGVVVVVAAGNDGSSNDRATPEYPCNFTQPNLVCVAALDQNYQLATFSNYGTTSVDVGAPGTNIVSTWAGAKAVFTDPLNSGWFGSSTTSGSGGGWFYSTTALTSGSSCLVDPGQYPSGSYNTGTDDRAYKSFDLSGAAVASLEVSAIVNVANGDHIRAAYANTSIDPFAGTGTTVWDGTNIATYPNASTVRRDISGCIGTTCTIGFQLHSDASANDRGVVIAAVRIGTLTLNATSYHTQSGTSMATPEVAGLATMLRAYNPQYTSADVVNAIVKGGKSVASLAGKTTTGKAVDVMSSLAYINAPTGLVAVVQ